MAYYQQRFGDCGTRDTRRRPATTGALPMTPSPFLEQVRSVIRLKHLSYKTEQAYLHTIKRFILFHDKRQSAELGVPEIRA